MKMKKRLLTVLMICTTAIAFGQTGMSKLLGVPENVEKVNGTTDMWYWQLVSEHEDAILNYESKESLYTLKASKKDEANYLESRIYLNASKLMYQKDDGTAGYEEQRTFGIYLGTTYAKLSYLNSNFMVQSGDNIDHEASYWEIVPVDEKSAYCLIINKKTKKCLTLGKMDADGNYEVLMAPKKTNNNTDQHWKLRLKFSK